MQRLSAQHEATVTATPEAVWDMLKDWTGLMKWWPEEAPFPILRCDPIGDPGTLPFGRRVHLPGGAVGDEFLIFLNDEGRRLYYYLSNGSLPGVSNYLATTTVDDAGDGKAKMGFASTFDAPPGTNIAVVKSMILGVYDAIARGIGKAAADPR